MPYIRLLFIPFFFISTNAWANDYAFPSAFSLGDDKEFFLGLATAPAHTENELHDAWSQAAQEGKIAAFHNQPQPEQRLLFWTHPEIEISWMVRSGVKVVRLAVDWGRLVPEAPSNCKALACDIKLSAPAVERYRYILGLLRKNGISVSLGLFHHSLPLWALHMGFESPDVRNYFVAFGVEAAKSFGDLVDNYIIFNEPLAFAFMTHVTGFWPGNNQGAGIPQLFDLPFFHGKASEALKNMASAHNELYEKIHKIDVVVADSHNRIGQGPASIGIAHITMELGGIDPASAALAQTFNGSIGFSFTDAIASHLDFIGINYYGTEYLHYFALTYNPDFEYTDSGRSISPLGLGKQLIAFHERYNIQRKNRSMSDTRNLPFVVTEFGIADSTDTLRPAYLVESLAAIAAAKSAGVPVKGAFFWTLSDNTEWLDGYCSKFGLLTVDRTNLHERSARPSYSLFQKIAATGTVTKEMRVKAWDQVRNSVDKPRPMCRDIDQKKALDEPRTSWFKNIDWTFKSLDESTKDQRIAQ